MSTHNIYIFLYHVKIKCVFGFFNILKKLERKQLTNSAFCSDFKRLNTTQFQYSTEYISEYNKEIIYLCTERKNDTFRSE